MYKMRPFLGGIVLIATATALTLIPQQASSQSATNSAQAAESNDIPAFHKSAPTGSLPDTLAPSLFSQAIAQNAYTVAARDKKVFYQEPCYCHCDRSRGHSSLLDCFGDRHGAECGTCMAEAFYTYEQTRKGKTAEQIRDGIERGEWQQVDLKKYQTPLPSTK